MNPSASAHLLPGGAVLVPVSVVVIARDEEELLPGALASVSGWADDVVVVIDRRTRDRSREVAASAGARVLEHEFTGSGAQYNWGLGEGRHRWGFVLDADERMTDRLRHVVAAAVAAPVHPAYAVRRANFAFGRRLRFGDWGRDRVVRLLDRERCRFEERAVHGAVHTPSVGRLPGVLEHHSLRSLDQYLPKLHEYARRGALDLAAEGRRGGVHIAVARAEWRFVRAFLLRGGFLDGRVGLAVAILAAHGSFLKWLALWEATRRNRRP